MKKIFYEKVGRRYVPVSEYDSEFMDSFRKGTHLVVSVPGGASYYHDVDPNYAAMIAAGTLALDKISSAMLKAQEMRPVREITIEQRKAYDEFLKTMPEGSMTMLTYGSIRESAEAGIKVMQEEAMKLMAHPSVKKAYDHFILTCQLTREEQVK